MNIRGAIFDLDGTLTDSMYIWQKAPVDLMRRYGGDPPEDLARDLKEMGRREAAEYLRSRFSLSTTPEELMDTLNDLVTEEYRSRVPLKPGADRLLAGWRIPASPAASPPPARRSRPAPPWNGWDCGRTSASPSAVSSTAARPGRTSIWRPPAVWGPFRRRRWCLRMPLRCQDRPRGRLPGLRRLGRLCRRGSGRAESPGGLVRAGPGRLGPVRDGEPRPAGRFQRRIGGTTFRRLIKLQCKEASGKEASI